MKNIEGTILWNIDSIDTIGGFPVTVLGDPNVIDIPDGEKAVEFDGIDDGLVINTNPLVGLAEFTVEVLFNPYTGGPFEQRFVHMQQ
ncbi:MAG: LamG domain-containing protein, partial [Chitinispirillia bacterium]